MIFLITVLSYLTIWEHHLSLKLVLRPSGINHHDSKHLPSDFKHLHVLLLFKYQDKYPNLKIKT